MRQDSSLYAKCCGTTFTGPDPESMHVEYHNHQFDAGRRTARLPEKIDVPLVDIVTVEPGSMIHYEYDAGNGPVKIIGILMPNPVGMARLGNQGFRIRPVRPGAEDRFISRYAKVRVIG